MRWVVSGCCAAAAVAVGTFVSCAVVPSLRAPTGIPLDAAALVRSGADMPIASDGTTRLLAVDASGTKAVFRLALSDEVTKDDFERAAANLRKYASRRFCRLGPWRAFLSGGGMATLSYADSNGAPVGAFDVDPASCDGPVSR